MTDEITAAGSRVVDMLGACAEAPDDLATAAQADEALDDLERLLATRLGEQ
jgi:hypothetical protein